jgi:ATP-binding cassette subfamily B protein
MADRAGQLDHRGSELGRTGFDSDGLWAAPRNQPAPAAGDQAVAISTPDAMTGGQSAAGWAPSGKNAGLSRDSEKRATDTLGVTSLVDSNSRVITRLLHLSWQYRGWVLWVFVLQVALLALTLGGLSFTGLAIDIVRHALEQGAPLPRWPLGWAPPASWTTLWQLEALGLGVLLMALLRGGLTYVYELAAGRLIHVQIVPTLRRLLFARLQRLSFRFFDSNSTGGIINRVTRDVQLLRSFVDGVLIQGTILALALAVFLSYMLATHVRLTVVSLALTPLLFVATRVFSQWAQSAYAENRTLSDHMVRTMAEGIDGVLVTKVFGREADQLSRFEERNAAVRDQQQQIFRNVSRYTPAIDLLARMNVAVLLAYGATLVRLREVSLGELVVFAGLLQQFAARASAMAGVANTLQQALTGARRVFEVFDTVPEVRDRPNAKVLGPGTGEIIFDGVSFAYGDGKLALDAVDLRVSAGKCVGILGETGSGKTSLLSLIPRFYDPTAGRILLDGLDLREVTLGSLRRQIGIVFQETFLFRDTIAENIAFGAPEATAADVIAAAKKAGAHEFIDKLRDGYQTLLAEGAVNLSGGQRQRLAIARALLLEPRVLLLDDPTTAVDARTERAVLSAIDAAKAGRTTLVVSNRISSLSRADEVVVLRAGRIIERGAPSDLLRAGGEYARTAALQGLDETTLGWLGSLKEAQ